MKKHQILLTMLVFAVIAACIFIGINLHWRSSTQASIELDKFLSTIPSRPKALKNINDPPRKPDTWFDKDLESAIKFIDDGDTGVKDAVGKAEGGAKIIAVIQLPIKDLRHLADEGDGAAQYVLSIRLRNGIKILRNELEAYRVLELSAANKFPLALRAKALQYDDKPKSSNPADDYVNETAKKLYYEEAAELGDPYSMLIVGSNYFSPSASFSDLNKCFTWLNKSLKNNDVRSSILTHSFIVNFFDQIDSSQKLMYDLDLRKSYESLRSFADSDIGGAQETLAQLLWEQKFPDELIQGSSREIAIKWYIKAANKGRRNAQRFLGELYASGRYVPRDSIVAAKWLTLATEQAGYPSELLAERFFKGDGVPLDKNKGIKWLKISGIHENNKLSQYQLGQCYWNGRGVKKNLILAYAWLNVSNTDLKFESSCQMLRKNLSEKNILEAEKLSKKIFFEIQNTDSVNLIK